MNMLVMAFSGVGRVYDPPCDPGFNCEGLSDDALTGGIILWGLFFAGIALIIIGAILRDFVKGLYWRYKYGSADGVKSERESLIRRGYEGFTVRRDRSGIWVTWDCPVCDQWNFNVPYSHTFGKSQTEACKKANMHKYTAK